jgi:Protein of unknown function (DUF1573)
MFKKAIMGMSVCLILSGVVLASQAAKSPAGSPKVSIASKDFDAGEVKEGDIVKHAFTLRNEGNADLVIEEIAPGCGCETVDFDRVIPPGRDGKITVQVRTAGFMGAAVKTAIVKTNDPALLHFEIAIRMVILSATPKGDKSGPFIVSPGLKITSTATAGSPTELVANIYTQSSQPVKITKVDTPGDPFKVDFHSVPDGTRSMVKATASPSLATGRHSQTVKLITDNKEFPELVLTFELDIGLSLSLSPTTLVFDRVTLPASGEVPAASKFLWLRRSGGPALEVKKVESTLPFMGATLDTDQDGRTFILRVKFISAPPKGTHAGKIVVTTNNPNQPTVEAALRVVVQ